jgi:predicted alpha/beta-fold hydrolase
MEFEPFRPRFPWYGRHLQSMRNPLRPPPVLPTGPGERVALPLGDGDVLQARRDQPPGADPAHPTVVLLHGLGGCETSNYMLAASRYFTLAGAVVYRVSLRGAGPSQATCRDWSHGGRYRDVEAFLPQLDAGPAGLFVVGFSLGGSVLLNYLARGRLDPRLRGAASVSAPLDLPAASVVLHQAKNRLYHDYLLHALKRDYLNPHASLTDDERAAVERARTLFEVDDRFTAPHHGFGRAGDYYREVSALPRLPAITLPTVLLHAVNDPFVPAEPYRRVRAGAVRVGLAAGGGHLGFHDRGGLWHLRQCSRFLAERGLATPPLPARTQVCS